MLSLKVCLCTTGFQPRPVGRYEALDSAILSSFLNGGWDYRLNEQLSQVLAEVAADNNALL